MCICNQIHVYVYTYGCAWVYLYGVYNPTELASTLNHKRFTYPLATYRRSQIIADELFNVRKNGIVHVTLR